MKSKSIIWAVFVGMFGATNLLAAAGDAAAGKTAYNSKCVTCHGANGEGKESIAKLLKVQMRDLKSKEALSKSDAELAKIILQGTGKMKAVKDVDQKTADDVVAYMRTLAKK
jgi:mono/diheme cytochrome c family protein